jgi:hypothetical protein
MTTAGSSIRATAEGRERGAAGQDVTDAHASHAPLVDVAPPPADAAIAFIGLRVHTCPTTAVRAGGGTVVAGAALVVRDALVPAALLPAGTARLTAPTHTDLVGRTRPATAATAITATDPAVTVRGAATRRRGYHGGEAAAALTGLAITTNRPVGKLLLALSLFAFLARRARFLLGRDASRQPQPIEAEAGTSKPAQHVAAGGEAAQGARHGMNVLLVHQ